ncbi:MAG: hypothetical protein IKK83_04745 [Clostridia bacterium]|nr:hypothetical protein [Clostridia bacterium]
MTALFLGDVMRGRLLALTLAILLCLSLCSCAGNETDGSSHFVGAEAEDFIGCWISSYDGDSMELLFRADGTGHAVLTPSSALTKVDIKYSCADGVLTVISYPVGDSVNFIDRADYDVYFDGGYMYIRPAGSDMAYHRFSPKE